MSQWHERMCALIKGVKAPAAAGAKPAKETQIPSAPEAKGGQAPAADTETAAKQQPHAAAKKK